MHIEINIYYLVFSSTFPIDDFLFLFLSYKSQSFFDFFVRNKLRVLACLNFGLKCIYEVQSLFFNLFCFICRVDKNY